MSVYLRMARVACPSTQRVSSTTLLICLLLYRDESVPSNLPCSPKTRRRKLETNKPYKFSEEALLQTIQPQNPS